MISEAAFDLLSGLADDNSKAWFDAHRDAMRDHVQLPFAEVLATVSERLSGGRSGSVVDEVVRVTTACAGLVEFGQAARR